TEPILMRINRPSEYTNRKSGDGPLSRRSRCGEGGFTMIEIAIAVGVIGFALVAIIGILPQGMNVQKDNREDTIISQDAPYFLNAIRNGEMRTNNNILANYVESITISNVNYGTNITYSNGPNTTLSTDMYIIGLLSFPEYDLRYVNVANVLMTN